MTKESKFKKETKIGIAVIGLLLVVFGIVLFNRINGADPASTVADTNRAEDAAKVETGSAPQKPIVVGNDTAELSHTNPTSHDAVEQRYAYSSRRHDVDQAAQKSYMPPSSAARYDDDRQEAGEIQPNRPAAYDDTYASDRTNATDVDARYETPSTHLPREVDHFRQRSLSTTDQNSAPEYADDQTNQTADGRYHMARQVVADDREIGREEFQPPYADNRQSVDQGPASAPYRQNNTYDPTTAQSAPYAQNEQQTPAPTSHNVLRDTTNQQPTPAVPAATATVEPSAVEYDVPPVRPPTGKYIVMPNDNYSVIAKKVYGDAGYFKALAEYNRQAHPRIHSLQVGDEVVAPELTVLREKFGSLCPKIRTPADPNQLATLVSATGPTKIYVVEEGDTIYDIAKFELGKASRWSEIIALNQDVLGNDIHFVRPGMRLRLPDDKPMQQRPSRMVRQVAPDEPLRR